MIALLYLRVSLHERREALFVVLWKTKDVKYSQYYFLVLFIQMYEKSIIFVKRGLFLND